MASDLNDLKKHVFYELLTRVGRAFILVDEAEGTQIGTRGFLPDEKEQGLVLVFNTKMKFEWNAAGISAKLVFGNTPHQCFIPVDAIRAVFSPELNAQFTVNRGAGRSVTAEDDQAKPLSRVEKHLSDKNVVRIDFTKKK